MEKANTSLARTKSDQLVESMIAGLKSPASSDHSTNGVVEGGGNLSRKSSRRLTAASPGRGGGKNTHIRKSRSAQISQIKLDLDDLSSGAALSRASSASLGLSFSFTGFTMPPEEIADSKPFSDEDIPIGMFFSPLWVAFFVGVIVGWLWKPKWARLGKRKLTTSLAKSLDFASPSSASSPSKSVASPMKTCSSSPCLNSIKMQPPNLESLALKKGVDKKASSSSSPVKFASSVSSPKSSEETSDAVTMADLHHLWQLVEEKDGGLPWIQMMDRSTPSMSYKAWRREPKDGPPQYRSSTIFEDATPEIVRDLFWDDEFRPRWDDMLANSSTIEECPTTGIMKVQWIRKFPFFCKDREYIIGRRIWESGRHYYCVTKGVDCPSMPRRDKPRRVDVYYSSWCIRAVESKRGTGQLTACEVLLFHHEEMGIPWEIAKLGVRKGMWGTVQKIEPGLRAYQEARASGAALSHSAFMAQVNTKISPEYLQSIGADDNSGENESAVAPEKPQGMNIPKMLVIGGAVALACSLDRGLVTKYVLFGVARRFANIGKSS